VIKASAVYEAGADQPVYDVQTMEEFVSRSMGRQRFPTLLLVSFAALALVLDDVLFEKRREAGLDVVETCHGLLNR
jgi:hypothetical protein